MKRVRAVEPYIYIESSNFKHKPWVAWKNIGGSVYCGNYPRILHGLLFAGDYIPSFSESKKEVRLCFTTPDSLYFDTWQSVFSYEVIPFLWDCWELHDDKLCKWLLKHKIKKCIFTSEISQKRICRKIPYLNTFVITEGIDTELYPAGKPLLSRELDYYSFGRIPSIISNIKFEGFKVALNGSNDYLHWALQNAKVTVAVPRCDVVNGCHETLTQRYWECMLSRIVMVGRCPNELLNLIGYDPVVPIDYDNYEEQINHIITHIEDYQILVDKNREVALRMSPWDIRMKKVMEWLKECGYCL